MSSQRSAANTAADGGTGTAAGDPEQLAREIEHTRAQLGETVHALVAKTDVKARATGALRRTGAQLTGALTRARRQASDQLAPRVGAVAAKATTVTPQRAAGKAVAVARKQPVPLALAAVAAVGVLIAVVRRGR